MTISTSASKITALGNGATVVFSFGFLIPQSGEEQITYTDALGNQTILNNTQYMLSGFGNPAGGTVTYPLGGSPTPIATGTSLTIARVLPFVQGTTISNQGAFYPQVVEGALDYEMMVSQQLNQTLKQAILAPIVDQNPMAQLPAAAQRAGKYLAFDSNGNPVATGAASTINSLTLNGATSGTLVVAPQAVASGVLAFPNGNDTLIGRASTDTITGAKTFNPNTLILAGATSGTTLLNATAIASGTLTLPAATDTLVARNTTDTLLNKTLVTPTISGTNGAQAPLTAAFNDSSSVAGNAAKFWNPLYFTNAGTAIVHRLNRVLVGEAAVNSSDIGPVTTKDWMETLLSNTTAVSQFASVSATGQLASMSAARSSDYRTIFGAATGGAQGVTGVGYNDDTTAATTPIAAGVVGVAIRKAGVVGITLNQFDMNNGGSVVDTTPFGGVNSGSTWALGLTAGSFSALGTANVTGAMYIGAGATAKFRKGIISMNGALDTSLGAGGGGITYEAYEGQSFRWLNSSNAVDAELWGSPNGLTTNTPVLVSQNTTHQAIAAGTLLHLEAADGASNFLIFDTFVGNNTVVFRSADGTSAVPAAIGSGRTLMSLLGQGYANGAYQAARSKMVFATTEAWTSTAQGANVVISATPETTTTTQAIATFSGAGLTVNQGFSRGAPVTQTASFTLASNQNWIVCNGTATITVTLPAASLFNGREVTFKTIAAFTVVSASSNVVPLAGGAAGTAILAATAGKWATLVSDGTNWNINASN